jgi:hypothetical protein
MIYYTKKHISNLLINRTKRILYKTMYVIVFIIGKLYMSALCMVDSVQWPVLL